MEAPALAERLFWVEVPALVELLFWVDARALAELLVALLFWAMGHLKEKGQASHLGGVKMLVNLIDR